jgi:hypothetical protein
MKTPYTNETDKFVHIGSVTIAPGATRDVEDSHIPGYTPPASTTNESPENPLARIAVLSVDKAKAQLKNLTDGELAQLGDLEKAGQQRKTLINAIADELLQRAAGKSITPENVGSLSSQDLLQAIIDETAKGDAADAGLLDLLKAEADKRKAKAITELSDDMLKLTLDEEEAKGADADQVLITALKSETDKRAAAK